MIVKVAEEIDAPLIVLAPPPPCCTPPSGPSSSASTPALAVAPPTSRADGARPGPLPAARDARPSHRQPEVNPAASLKIAALTTPRRSSRCSCHAPLVASAPLWVAVLGSFGVGAILSALITRRVTLRGQDLQRSTALDEDRSRRRTEALASVRWAAELAVSEDPARARLGASSLAALQESTLTLPEDKALFAAIYRAAIEPSLPPPTAPGAQPPYR